MKLFAKYILLSFILSLIILVVLIFTKEYTLNHFLEYINDRQGTKSYVGETKAINNIETIIKVIYPILFVLSLLFIYLQKKSKIKSLILKNT